MFSVVAKVSLDLLHRELRSKCFLLALAVVQRYTSVCCRVMCK